MCFPGAVQSKLRSMSCEQLRARLSVLTGKCALQLLRVKEDSPPADPTTATISGPLHDAWLEFTSLVMGCMVWDTAKFRLVLNTNLDTLQPFAELLPAQHWVSALNQLQLSDQQLSVLMAMHDRHFWSGRSTVIESLQQNLVQLEANSKSLLSLSEQQAEAAAAAGSGSGAAGSGAAGSGAAAVGAAGTGPAAAAGTDPVVLFQHAMESQEALAAERARLLQRWLLVGVHFGIVTACTLSPYQQALFMASSFPSIPRMDLAIHAWQAHVAEQAAPRHHCCS